MLQSQGENGDINTNIRQISSGRRNTTVFAIHTGRHIAQYRNFKNSYGKLLPRGCLANTDMASRCYYFGLAAKGWFRNDAGQLGS